MRSAATILGLVGGLLGLVAGIFSYGYTEVINAYGEIDGLFEQVGNQQLVRMASVVSPVLALAGAGMARIRALWAGILMLAGAGGMYMGFGVGFFTIFPITFCAVAAILALAAGQPDEPTPHF